MADEATVTTTETIEPVVTEAAPAVATEAKTEAKPSPPKDAQTRAREALEKIERDEATGKFKKKEDGEKVEAKEAPKADDKKPEPAKEPEKVEPRLSRGLAILAEREAKVRNAEAGLKARVAETEAKLAGMQADVQLVQRLKEANEKGGLGEVLRVLTGGNLKQAIEELSRTYEEPTPEAIAKRVAAEEWDLRQKAAKEAEEQAAKAKAEREAADEQVQAAEFCERASEICGGIETTAYPRVVTQQVNGAQFWDAAKKLQASLGRKVEPTEVLAAIEKVLKEREDAARAVEERRNKPAPAATQPAPIKAKTEEPLKQVRREVRKPSAMERAEAALRRINIS